MSDFDAILENLKRVRIGKASAIMAELAASPAGQVVKGCIAGGRRERLSKATAVHERIIELSVALGKVREELARTQTRLEFLESPASVPRWIHPN